MKPEPARSCRQSAVRSTASGTQTNRPGTGIRSLSLLGEMPQHVMGDKPFVSMPQLVLPSPPSALDDRCGHTPSSRRASLGAPLSLGALRPATHSPLDSCSQPLCQPRAQKHGARTLCYSAAGPRSSECGWRAFTPKCLQALNTPRGFLGFLCAASFLQGMTVNGFINTVITSIERRYDLHSYQSGLIASSYDLAACLCLTFVSYFGGSGHKPRWLGWGVLLMGAGSLVFALPHFTTGPYQVEVDEGLGLCRANRSVACGDRASSLSSYRLVFMLGQFLHGAGATPLYTLGVTYLDENVKSSYSPVYIAIFYTAAILGPAAGYLIGGALLNIYTELGRRSIWLLLKNPVFILLCLAGATEATLIAGMSTFGPKFLESQFSLSASEAATLFGYLVVPAGGGGTFLGGFFVNKLKLRGSSIIKFCLTCSLTSLLAILVFFAHCPNVPMVGVTARHNSSVSPEGHLELTAACNAACGCGPGHYSPVCGSDGLMYYSPCHAGCLEVAAPGPGGQKVYRDCRCVLQNFSSGFGHATAGKCTSTCQSKPLLLVFIFVVITFTFLSSIPALTATLRCVCDQQRSFALGIQWIVVRTLGGIPGPIAFGWVIDKACLLWQDQCGQQGSCFLYQNAAMSRYMLIAGLVYKVLGFLFFAAAYVLYKSLPGSPQGLEASLPSQSSASDSPSDLQGAPSGLQSNV
ncbi:solute carrier organic anion transporter family member 4A1 isoform X4 [Eptesicus fuscus]|uniref:solute carrier organic anion transporter family member 4A1 isoform X4 n=1 Tax=Eptesicus fuscus TaxID=29078 RepID=UPI00240477E6|nr:solute carrier organic anion transporter family member 4A1 isoform X4 [Eptesicus fuscus]